MNLYRIYVYGNVAGVLLFKGSNFFVEGLFARGKIAVPFEEYAHLPLPWSKDLRVREWTESFPEPVSKQSGQKSEPASVLMDQ